MVFQLAALSVFSFVLLVICDKGKKLFGPALFRTIRFSMLFSFNFSFFCCEGWNLPIFYQSLSFPKGWERQTLIATFSCQFSNIAEQLLPIKPLDRCFIQKGQNLKVSPKGLKKNPFQLKKLPLSLKKCSKHFWRWIL